MTKAETKEKPYSLHTEKPVTDLHELLDLLPEYWRDSGKRYVYMRQAELYEPNVPEVWKEWNREGSSGQDSWGVDRFQVDRALVQKALDDGLLQTMEVPYWGGSHKERDKLVVTRRGEELRKRLYEEKKAAAHTLLVPGEHSAWSSIFEFRKSEREKHYPLGELYFEFVTPMKERVRVWIDQKRIEKLEKDEE